MTIARNGLSLADGFDLSGLTIHELWFGYVSIGGTDSPRQLAQTIAHDSDDAHEHNVIAQAINEHFIDIGQDHPVGYVDAPLPDHDAVDSDTGTEPAPG